MQTTQDKKLAAARFQLITHPNIYMKLCGCLLTTMTTWSTDQKDAPSIGWTDANKNVWISAQWLETAPMKQVMFLLAHEANHKLLFNSQGFANVDKLLWNIAQDFVINGALVAAGAEMIPGGLHDSKYDGWSTVAVYQDLAKNVDKNKKKSAGDTQDGTDWSPDCIPKGSQIENTEFNGNAAAKRIQSDIRSAASMAGLNAGKLQGLGSAELEILLKQLMDPQVDWRRALRHLTTEIAKSDFSWRRLNRPMMSLGYRIPSLYSLEVGQLVVAVDTSGSMLGEPLQAVAAEVAAIHRMVRPSETIILYSDTSVCRVDRFKTNQTPVITPHGGGGTSFAAAFDWVRENRIKPAAFIYATDGYGEFPAYKPSYPVYWCATEQGVQYPFGKVIHITV